MQLNVLLKAACVVDGFRYVARTYHVSDHGLTLVTSPDFPKTDQFQLECDLGDGNQAALTLRTSQRKPVRWNDYAFHMLNTEICDESQQAMADFVARLQARFSAETTSEADAAERRGRGETVAAQSTDEQRLHIRLTFNLPLTTDYEGRKYHGMTRDFSIRGIGATFKDIIPVAESMNIVCEDPEGHELSFRVREMNRQIEKSDSFPLRIGFKILSANKRYRDFLEKHHVWNQKRLKDET